MKTLKISNVVYVAMLLYSMTTNGQTLYVPGGTVGTSSNGNVGIGTLTPNAPLEIVGSDLQIRLKDNTNTLGVNERYDIRNWESNLLFEFQNDDGGPNIEMMRITRTGDVGIGTKTPSGKLEIQNGDDATGSRIRLNNQEIKIIDRWNNDDYTAKIWAQWPGYGILNFGINDSYGSDVTTPALSIRGSGNVGIGTINPSAPLTFGSNYSLPANKWGNKINLYGAVTSGAEYGIGVDMNDISFHARNGFKWYSGLGVAGAAQTPVVVINSTGNVGIGTTNPGAKLDILGQTIKLGGDHAAWTTRTDATTKSAYFIMPHYTNSEEAFGIFNASSGSGTNEVTIGMAGSASNAATRLTFFTAVNNTTLNGTERMRIDNNGNVGIGTVNPTQKLTVNGKILAEEVEVIADVPDYVFKEDYKLMSLAELDKFIKANKHLPEVPSEKEVMNNGGQVSLGEMNMTLLKKIEELTLYTIKLYELSNQQQEQINALIERSK